MTRKPDANKFIVHRSSLKVRRFIVSVLCLVHCAGVFAQLNTDRITAIGRNALYFDDYVLSIQYFNQVIKIKPYIAEPYLLRAIAKIQLSDYQGALKDLNLTIERNPFNPGAYYTRGYVERLLHDYTAAENDFTEALVYSPENKTYLLLRADVRSEMEHYDEAIADLDLLLRKDAKDANIHFEKGVILLHQKDTLSAKGCFQKTTEIDAYNSSNWSALGMVNLLLGNEDEALVDLTKAISLGSRWAGDYVNRSILYHRRNNFRGALADLDQAVQLDPNDAQTYFNRGLLRQEVGDNNRAETDLRKAGELAPDKYPAFILDAIIARKPIDEKLMRAQAESYQPPKRDYRKEFSARTAQNQSVNPDEEKYTSEARGSIQHRQTDVVNEPNIALTYYGQPQTLRRTNYYHYAVQQYNRLNILSAPLHFTTQEIPLTADMVNRHFEQINILTAQIDNYEGRYSFSQSKETAQNGAALYLNRAIEFALVQDYTSAMDDCTKAILLDPTLVFAHFLRANWRYKQIEYQRATGDVENAAKYEMDFEIMLRDYDYVTSHLPDFSFAYYNKANMLCRQKDFQAAISHYDMAIAADNEFAEAYFNRGLTYIYTNEIDKGIDDLSRAGELGIYQAYNLITRFK
ncbi:MAG: tetratricopeptide repeat protein [Paludibacteraceae bacterium]|nr:tetratricopeptide repeat protein [Paludibacteraceae bacterium]